MLLEDLQQRRQERCGIAVDEREVQAVADPEPIETRPRDRRDALRRRCSVDVENTPALGVRERPDAVQRCTARECGRGRPAAAQDHERDQRRQGDERLGSLPARRPDEADRFAGQADLLERRTKHPVDERRHGRERGASGTEDDRVAALEQLGRDIGRDVRPRLEVRADDADRNPALRHLQAVGQPPRPDFPLERRQCRRRGEARGDPLDTSLVEPQPVERPRIQARQSAGHVRLVRRQDLHRPLAQELRRAVERVRDGGRLEVGDGPARPGGLLFDELQSRQELCFFTFYINGRLTL